MGRWCSRVAMLQSVLAADVKEIKRHGDFLTAGMPHSPNDFGEFCATETAETA